MIEKEGIARLKKNAQQKRKHPKAQFRKSTSFRMNVLFFSIFVLFSVLIFRLGYLQIVKSDEFLMQLAKTDEVAVNTSVARGRIFDSEGRVLVDNDPQRAITYTKMTTTKSAEMLEIAEGLAEILDMDTKRITLADRQDYWSLLNSEKSLSKVTKEERDEIAKNKKLSDTEKQREVTRLTRERITDEELDELSDKDLKVLAIYREMMSGYAYSPQVIKSGDVTPEEFAIISEHISEFPGVNTTTDWERIRHSDHAILGMTTKPSEGLPRSEMNYYLSRGYSRNDRVGRSFFERHYEELLQGQKTVFKNIKDRTGTVIENKTIREGIPGNDLVLTMDAELEEAMEDIVVKKLKALKNGPNSKYLDRAFLIMLDPKNGDVLALVGKQILRNEETGKYDILDYSYGTFTTRYEIGSTVKMATLLAGYEHGGATVGETKIDQPLQIGGSRIKGSIFNRSIYNRIPMNDVEAIGRSSNVYMFKIAMEIGGLDYSPQKPIIVDLDAFDKMRASYSAFGLGVETGIDLPGEIGGKPGEKVSYSLLDLAIGQYDTYTPLQLAQYVATIANDGYRVAPRVLKEVREPSKDGKTLGPLVQEIQPKVLNKVNNTQAEIDQVKKGMHYTYYGGNGTARNLFAGASFEAAGKTGTAQTFAYDEKEKRVFSTVSLAHVGFAPYDNPDVAYAILVPHVSTNPTRPTTATNDLAQEAVTKFFELKEQKKSKSDVRKDIQGSYKDKDKDDVENNDEE